MTLTIRHACFPAALAVALVSLGAQAPKPKHINRAIELLEAGQPIYYTGSHTGTEGTYEAGKLDAQTWADYISYDMEHAPYDVKGLADYMRGLAAGGPTKSGHRTPAVIVNVPVNGIDEAAVRANAWMFRQVLATGVHGILLTPRRHAGRGQGLRRDRRACRSTGRASARASTKGAAARTARRPRRRSGASRSDEYEDRADAWPLNPNGELLLGLKLEDKYALANAEQNLKVPGIAFAEWGPGDMALSLGVRGPGNVAEKDPQMIAARAKVFAACKANKVFFLNSMNQNNVIDDDQGRRHGRSGQPAGRRDRPTVHEADDALVVR